MAEWTPELVKLEIYTPCAALEGLLPDLMEKLSLFARLLLRAGGGHLDAPAGRFAL